MSDERGQRRAGEPARDRATRHDERHVARHGQEDLPASGTGPRQPAAERVHVPATARRRKHREGQEQRDDLAADEEQAVGGDPSCHRGVRQRAGRSCDWDTVRGGGEAGRGAVQPSSERADLPRSRSAIRQGRDPAVAPAERREGRQARHRGDVAGQHRCDASCTRRVVTGGTQFVSAERTEGER